MRAKLRLGARVRARSLGIAATVLILSASTAASAHDRPAALSAIEIDLHGTSACPGRERFDALLSATTAGMRLLEGEVLRVDVFGAGRGVRGVLTVTSAGDEARVRSFEATTCEAVLDALALGAALAFVPSQEAAAPPAPASAASRRARRARRADASPGVAPDRTDPPTWRWSAGAQVAVLSLGSGAPLVAAPVFLGIERDHGPWAPAFRVAFFQAGASLAVGSASAALRWSLARLELSPFAVALTDGLVARAYGAVDAGALRVSAGGLADARTAVRPWIAPSLGGRLTLNALGPLWLEADLSLGVPLVRDTFALAPTTDVYRAPGVVPMGGLGLRVALP